MITKLSTNPINLMSSIDTISDKMRELQVAKKEREMQLVEVLVDLGAFHCFTINKAAVRRL